MRKLKLPKDSTRETFLTCVGGVLDDAFRERLEGCVDLIDDHSSLYESKAEEAELFQLIPLSPKTAKDFVVAADLTKKELMDVYSTYMVQRPKGRAIYDRILVSANDKCPFCGGIGQPTTLDHFLPKANYPQFSVSPANLLPSCKDCNTGKSNSLATEESEQVIHPYFDKGKFFKKKWVFARVASMNPPAIEFYADPPANWNDVDKERVKNHFNDFNLAKRYSIQAAEELSNLIYQRQSVFKGFSKDEYQDFLKSAVDVSIFINHWKRVMYQALALDDAFCTQVI